MKHTGQNLTPQEIARFELEATQAASRKETETKQQFQDEVRAENLGLETTLTGKRIQHQVRNSAVTEQQKKEEQTVAAIMSLFSATAGAKHLAEEILKLISIPQTAARASFAASTAVATTAVSMNPNDFIFEEAPISVSLATQKAVEMDEAYLSDLLEELNSLGPPGTGGDAGAKARATIALKILEEAETREMRRNPVTGNFVPSVQRVQYYETLHNPNMNERCERGQVCVFHYRPSAVGSKGIKRDPSDTFSDDSPAEVKLTVNEQVVAQRAPEFHI